MKLYKKFLYFSQTFLLILLLYGLNGNVIAMPPAPNRERGCSNTAMEKIITEKSRASIDNSINGYNTIFLVGNAVYQHHTGTIYNYGGTINVYLIPDTIKYDDLISGEEGTDYLGLPKIKFKNDKFNFKKYKIGSIPMDVLYYTKIGEDYASWYEEQCAGTNENTKIIKYHYNIEKKGKNYNLNLTSVEGSGGITDPTLFYTSIDNYTTIKNKTQIITCLISTFLFIFLGIKLQKKDENIKNKIIRLYSGLALFIILNFVNVSLVSTIFTKFNLSSLTCLSLGLFFSLIKNILIFKYILPTKRRHTILLSIFFSIIEISSLTYLFHILQIIEL